MSKSDIDSPSTLYINNNGGDVSFGGNVIPKATNTLDLGTSSVKWRTLYVGDGTGSTSRSTGNIQVNGGIGVSKNSYFGGDVTADQFHITNGSEIGHITFARGDYNYIHAKTSEGKIAFVVDGKSIGNETSEMIIQDGRIAPGTTNITNLGTSALRWKAIYGVIGNFSGNLTASGNLNINGTAAIGKDTTIGNGTVSTSTTTGALKVAGGIGVEG